VAFDVLEHVAKILGVRPVDRLHVLEAERLARSLEEVHELVYFQERDGRVHQRGEVPFNEGNERRAASRHVGNVGGLVRPSVRRCEPRLVHDHLDIRELRRRTLDERLHAAPRQSPKAASERRDRNRTDVPRPNLGDERLEPCFDVLDAALAAPVALRREVDDEPGPAELAGLEHEHPPRLHLVTLAGGGVFLEVVREGVLKLERDPPAHDPDAVDGVDHRLGVAAEDVALAEGQHRSPISNSTIPDGLRRVAGGSPGTRSLRPCPAWRSRKRLLS
jgi:hypothetical protein